MSHAPDTTLLLGHSPDPDDAFMFYAMAADKIVAQPGETLPVGALIAVVADEAATDAEVEAFIADLKPIFGNRRCKGI